MINQMLTKEEKKLFSKKNINRIKNEDFAEYINMYQAQLDSLRSGYSPEVYKNPIIEGIIAELEALINDLNDYYYNKVLVNHKASKRQVIDDLDREFKRTYESDLKPIDQEITREIKELKSWGGL